ncbi:hypothetical protein [Bradyrhizobium sp. USDA 3240]
MAQFVQSIDFLPGQSRRGAKLLRISVNDDRQRGKPWGSFASRCGSMGFEQDGGQSLAKLRADFIPLCEMIECLVLVEASHFDGPFDNRTGPPDHKPIALARDRNHPAIDGGGVALVDRNLIFASAPPLLQCREVEIGQLDRSLDLQDTRGFEKDDRTMGVDPLYRHGRLVRPGQERQYSGLASLACGRVGC